MSAMRGDHGRILRGAAWVVLFVFFGRAAGAVKEMAVAYQFGVSSVVDAYQMALTATTLVPGALVSALSVALIPLFVRTRHASQEEEALLVSEVQGVAIVLGGILALLSAVLGRFAILYVTQSLPVQSRGIVQSMVVWMSPVAAFALLVGVLSARLQARERHLNTLFESIPALVILAFIFFPVTNRGYLLLAWGTVVGFALQVLALSVAAHRIDGIRWVGRAAVTSPYWPELVGAIGVMAVGQVIMSFVTPVDQYFAAQLGEGAVATLGYANRLLSLGLSVGAMAIARASMPVFAGIVARGDAGYAASMARRWSMVMLIVGFCIVVVGWLFAPLAVRLVFQHGAFVARDTQAVTDCLRWGLFQIPGYFGGLVLVQLMASVGQFRFMAAIAVANFFVKMCMNAVLVPRFGLAGVMLATGVMYLFSFSVFFLRLPARVAAPRALGR